MVGLVMYVYRPTNDRNRSITHYSHIWIVFIQMRTISIIQIFLGHLKRMNDSICGWRSCWAWSHWCIYIILSYRDTVSSSSPLSPSPCFSCVSPKGRTLGSRGVLNSDSTSSESSLYFLNSPSLVHLRFFTTNFAQRGACVRDCVWSDLVGVRFVTILVFVVGSWKNLL